VKKLQIGEITGNDRQQHRTTESERKGKSGQKFESESPGVSNRFKKGQIFPLTVCIPAIAIAGL
jgi:hypothetical protein